VLVLAQQSLGPEEQTQWKKSAYKKLVVAESMKTCAVGKKNSIINSFLPYDVVRLSVSLCHFWQCPLEIGSA